MVRAVGQESFEEIVPGHELGPDERVAVVESGQPAAQFFERGPADAAGAYALEPSE